MSGRDLGLQPKRRVDGFKVAPGTPRRTRRRQDGSRRRRVHVSLRVPTAEALLSSVQDTVHATNTSVLVEALTAQPNLAREAAAANGFEPRVPAERRTTVTFYLAGHEVDLIDGQATAGGYRSRSAYLDDALHRHLVAGV